MFLEFVKKVIFMKPGNDPKWVDTISKELATSKQNHMQEFTSRHGVVTLISFLSSILVTMTYN